jgi:hypothetical protein
MNDQPRLERLQTILGYDSMIVDRVLHGWQPYFINFMFNSISGKQSTKLRVMEDNVVRIYSILVTHVVRKPNAPVWEEYRPKFVGCPDLPVVKTKKVSAYDRVVNEGWHFNGCLLLPPQEKCRLRVRLDDHFRTHRRLYCNPNHPLVRIHVTPMNFPAISDYVLKQYSRGNVSSDDILILPRSVSEVKTRDLSRARTDQK